MKNHDANPDDQMVDDFGDDEEETSFDSVFGKSSRGEPSDEDLFDEENAYHDPFEEEVEGLDDEEDD